MTTKQQSSQGRFFFASKLITLGVIILLGCSQNSFGQWDTNGNNINNTNSGNVGVGTASPNTKLAVEITNTTGVESPIVTSQIQSTTQGGIYQYREDAQNGHSSLRFKTYYGWPVLSMQTPLTLKYDGNVGIGTTSPTSKLHVLGGNVFHQFSATAGQEHGFYTAIRNNHFSSNLYNDGLWKMLSTGKGAVISTAPLGGSAFNVYADNTSRTAASLASLTNLFNITMDGNVGIGIMAPNYRLDVQGGSINAAGGLCIAGDCKTAWSQVGGGSGAVSSVFGRTGAVVAATNDYTWAQINKTTSSLGDLQTRNASDLNAGTVPVARLGLSGTAGVATFLRGDNTWAPASQWASGTNNISYSGGNVGIGAPTPSAKLEVVGNVSVTGTGNITATGTIQGTSVKATYQDVAEWVESSQELPTGTLVVLDHTKTNQVIASSKAYDTRVAGVISERPGIALGESGANKVLVATTGRVRLTVDASNGPIQIGDLLVTSGIPGVAMKSEAINVGGVQIHRPGTLVGKALEPLAKGQGKILVLLSLQ